MALPLKKTIYAVYLVVMAALIALLSLGIRQYQLYHQHESIISRTESLIFQFSIIREHVADALLDCTQIKLTGISEEMEKLNSNLGDILSNRNISDEYKLTFLNSIDLPGIILLLRKIEAGSNEEESIRNLNREMRTLGERLILFDRLLVNNAKERLIGFQNIIIGSTAFVVFLLVTVLMLFHRQLILPVLQLVRQGARGEETMDFAAHLSNPSREIAELAALYTELSRKLRDLRMEMERQRDAAIRLITGIDGFFLTISKSGQIIEVSAGAAPPLALASSGVVGRGWRELFVDPPALLPAELTTTQQLEKLAATEQNILLTLADEKEGPKGTVRCSFTRYGEKGNEAERVYCLGVNLTDEVNRIRELELCLQAEKNKKAEMVRISHLAVLGELATGVAHEVANLSNGIINYAQLLADAACDPDQELEREKLFRSIIIEGEKIAGLAQNLLAYGQDDAQSRELAEIGDVLANSLALMGHYFRIDGTRVITSLDSIPRCRINGRQMQQVFLSILHNARRALNERFPQKDDRKKMEISAQEVEKEGKKMMRLVFTDFGVGISAENIGKVFEPSYTTKPASEGVGMGLTVSRELVLQHNGTITLESKENDHTAVIIEIPIN
ncbi:MAG: sensor histidine kinase [Thermodesulfobacteriota bacterium]